MANIMNPKKIDGRTLGSSFQYELAAEGGTEDHITYQ